MTENGFRKLALSLPETLEAAHMGHPDFRVKGRIFASLAWPDRKMGMVKLTSDQQAFFTHAHPKVFQPVKGGWGRQGATSVTLASATAPVVMTALWAAWRNVAPKTLVRSTPLPSKYSIWL